LQSVPPGSVVVGIPGKVIKTLEKTRNSNDE
jgi:serine acetyltransferase